MFILSRLIGVKLGDKQSLDDSWMPKRRRLCPTCRQIHSNIWLVATLTLTLYDLHDANMASVHYSLLHVQIRPKRAVFNMFDFDLPCMGANFGFLKPKCEAIISVSKCINAETEILSRNTLVIMLTRQKCTWHHIWFHRDFPRWTLSVLRNYVLFVS